LVSLKVSGVFVQLVRNASAPPNALGTFVPLHKTTANHLPDLLGRGQTQSRRWCSRALELSMPPAGAQPDHRVMLLGPIPKLRARSLPTNGPRSTSSFHSTEHYFQHGLLSDYVARAERQVTPWCRAKTSTAHIHPLSSLTQTQPHSCCGTCRRPEGILSRVLHRQSTLLRRVTARADQWATAACGGEIPRRILKVAGLVGPTIGARFYQSSSATHIYQEIQRPWAPRGPESSTAEIVRNRMPQGWLRAESPTNDAH